MELKEDKRTKFQKLTLYRTKINKMLLNVPLSLVKHFISIKNSSCGVFIDIFSRIIRKVTYECFKFILGREPK